jgi:hypothetical protein
LQLKPEQLAKKLQRPVSSSKKISKILLTSGQKWALLGSGERCYDFKNIFGEKIDVFDSKQR